MAAEERNISKNYYKVLLYTLKVIPVCMAVCEFLHTLLSLWGIESPIISYLGGCSFITWSFIYLAALVFKFCIYHRMFLYYVLLNNILSIYEFHFGIPVNDVGLLCLYSVITAVFLFLVLYFYRRERLCYKQ